MERYADDYLAYETERQFDYRAIALRSLGEAGLRPEEAGEAESRRSVLDVGCATGALLAAFAEAGWKATGVEVSEPMAAYARSRFGLDVRTGTLESSRLGAAAYGAVVATHLIEHLNDPRAFLAEARRVMKPNGRLYLITPNADGFQAALMGRKWRSAIRDHLYLFSARTLSSLLSSEGFEPEYLGTWGGWPAGMKPAWLKRPMDKAAKEMGAGDVMVIRAKLAPASDGGRDGSADGHA